MKKNLYFKQFYEHKSPISEFLLELFFNSCSYPRMIVEVLVRKNFGRRYFSFTTALIVAAILLAVPPVVSFMYGDFFTGVIDTYSWYLFIALFLGSAIMHKVRLVQRPGSFDFNHFSRYAGDVRPFFYRIGFWNWWPDIRTIETILEPLAFFLLGVVLHLIGFNLGALFILVSIVYSISYVAAYKEGDKFVLNLIDEMIMNEEMENSFVQNKPADETRGVRFYVRKPKLYTLRQQLAEAMVHDPSKVEFTLAE